MNLVFVTEEFAVCPDDVSSLEHYDHWKHSNSPSGGSIKDHSGTIVIQKNGRKTYIRDLTVKDVHGLIYGKDVEEIQEPKMLTSIQNEN